MACRHCTEDDRSRFRFCRREIENHIVARTRRNPHRNGIQSEGVTRFPGDDMIRAGGIATHAETADEFAFLTVERQTTAENNCSADRFAD